VKEEDIRPADIFKEYLRLSVEDAERCFSDVSRSDIDCPACGSNVRVEEFDKHGFGYVSCDDCATLYQSPRPQIDAFERFYSDSISATYWSQTFFPAVAEPRRERIFKPRVERLVKLCEEKGIHPSTVMDVGAGYGIFLEEWKKKYPQARTIAVEPSIHLAEICRQKGIEVIQEMAENVSGYDAVADLVICFEVLEHVHDVLSFISILKKFVKPGGYLMVSTLGVDGFDIQVLWDKSNSIAPPHHLNFLSIQGFATLFNRAGLVETDVLTPGVLDVDIVRNSFNDDPSCLQGNRFIEVLLNDEMLSSKFQDFLIENKLSSHTWIIAKNSI